MQVTVGKLVFNAWSVNVARLVGATAEYDIDVEPMEPGKVRITATGHAGGKIVVTGKTHDDACEQIINRLAGELHGR